MITYFGFGSNMCLTSLRAKGVVPVWSQRAVLRGWQLAFDVEHFFRHEGGMGNIRPTGDPDDAVQGVVHRFEDAALAPLDKVEAYGIGYDRITVALEAPSGPVEALAYVGMPEFLNPACKPTRRYLNILARGAREAGLEPAYIAALEAREIQQMPDPPPFDPPGEAPAIAPEAVAAKPMWTAIAGSVFDMSACRPRHRILYDWFGGREVTLFHLHRLDTSDGAETLADVRDGRLTDWQRRYLNIYLHAFAEEYDYVGRYVFP